MVTDEERQFMGVLCPGAAYSSTCIRRLALCWQRDGRVSVSQLVAVHLPASVIYYGDEICMGDDIRLQDRAECVHPCNGPTRSMPVFHC
jgi:hypothetical protein